jgi:prophage maintenance system killer protein
VGNVSQTFGGKALYPTIEEKAAHLLYFVVKNHPFVDGNKRSGAYAFVWFLQRAGILDRKKITPSTLTAITLFIAESDPKNKERMIRLVLQLLKK